LRAYVGGLRSLYAAWLGSGAQYEEGQCESTEFLGRLDVECDKKFVVEGIPKQRTDDFEQSPYRIEISYEVVGETCLGARQTRVTASDPSPWSRRM